jgi:hypothetical protein
MTVCSDAPNESSTAPLKPNNLSIRSLAIFTRLGALCPKTNMHGPHALQQLIHIRTVHLASFQLDVQAKSGNNRYHVLFLKIAACIILQKRIVLPSGTSLPRFFFRSTVKCNFTASWFRQL